MKINHIDLAKKKKHDLQIMLHDYLKFLRADEYNHQNVESDIYSIFAYLKDKIIMNKRVIPILYSLLKDVDLTGITESLTSDDRSFLDQLLRDLNLMPELERINIVNSENAENDEIFIKKILNNLKDLLPEIMNDDKESKRKAEYISHELESGAYKLVRIHRELDRS